MNGRWRLARLAAFSIASFGAAAIGGALTAGSVETWYRTLRKPPVTPPDAVFGPVWTLLYVLIALAGWLSWRRAPDRTDRASAAALVAWAVQLALNVAWSGVFFGARQPAAALAVIAALWVAIATTIALTARVTRVGALLLVPYLAWVTFATYLNAGIWWLNGPQE